MQSAEYLKIARELLDKMVESGRTEISSADVMLKCESNYDIQKIWSAIHCLTFARNAICRPTRYVTNRSNGFKTVYFEINS